VLVPRGNPVSEQLLRARLFAARGYFACVEPQDLTPEVLIAKVLETLKRPAAVPPIDLDGLPRIRERVRCLLAARDETPRAARTERRVPA
jgi:predicted glycosyltransferase